MNANIRSTMKKRSFILCMCFSLLYTSFFFFNFIFWTLKNMHTQKIVRSFILQSITGLFTYVIICNTSCSADPRWQLNHKKHPCSLDVTVYCILIQIRRMKNYDTPQRHGSLLVQNDRSFLTNTTHHFLKRWWVVFSSVFNEHWQAFAWVLQFPFLPFQVRHGDLPCHQWW